MKLVLEKHNLEPTDNVSFLYFFGHASDIIPFEGTFL